MSTELAQISVYLAKDKKTFANVLVDDSDLEKRKAYVSHNFKTDGASCQFIYFEAPSSKANPPWLDFVNAKLPKASRIDFSTRSSSANGIMMIEYDGRLFVATFGRSAGSYINKRALEPDFGIRTAMNMCGNEEIRQTKSQSASPTITHIDRQVSAPSEALIFGLNEAEDLHYISAQIKGDKKVTLQGRDSLTIKIIGQDKLTWSRLIEYCGTFRKKFASKDFVDLFPNYKNFDSATEEQAEKLDEALLDALRKKDFRKIQFAIPEFLSDDEYSFTYANNPSRENTIYAFLDVDQLKEHLKLDNLTLQKLQAKQIYAYSPAEDRILEDKKWSVYDCLVFEHALGTKYFILSNGQWMLVEANFYKAIVEFTNNTLREEKCEALYENIDISDDQAKKNLEAKFNQAVVARRPSNILFDRAKLQIGMGRRDKEFCDVLDLEDDGVIRIINCKPHKDASSINYLFLQAKFYCESFLSDPFFLKDIRAHIDASPSPRKADYLAYVKDTNAEVHGQDYRICLWLLYDRADPVPSKTDIPLIAQYELKIMHDRLQRVCKFKDIILRFVPVVRKQYTTAKDPKAA